MIAGKLRRQLLSSVCQAGLITPSTPAHHITADILFESLCSALAPLHLHLHLLPVCELQPKDNNEIQILGIPRPRLADRIAPAR